MAYTFVSRILRLSMLVEKRKMTHDCSVRLPGKSFYRFFRYILGLMLPE